MRSVHLVFRAGADQLREREILTSVLHHLREIERRRLYSAMKYQSLFDYAQRRLGYSEDQAYRRIEALRLLKELPEIEEKIADGSLNLTNIGLARSVFKSEAKADRPITKETKLEIIESLENKSKREAEKTLVSRFGTDIVLKEQVRQATETASVLTLPIDDEFQALLAETKAMLAHSDPNISTLDLLKKLMKSEISRKSDKEKAKRALTRRAKRDAMVKAEQQSESTARPVKSTVKSANPASGGSAISASSVVPQALRFSAITERRMRTVGSIRQRT